MAAVGCGSGLLPVILGRRAAVDAVGNCEVRW